MITKNWLYYTRYSLLQLLQLGRAPFPTMLIITRTVNLNITNYNESIINQTVKKLYCPTIFWKRGKHCQARANFPRPLAIFIAHDIRCALRARARIRVHPVERSNELISILYTFEHNNVRVCCYYVCLCIWQCVVFTV